MSKESAMQFALAVMEDQELRDRTAKLKPEEVLSIAKEMGYDFTEEELTAAMDENKELSADELEAAAGGYPGDTIYERESPKHCYFDMKGPLHNYVVVGHEERWMFWAWTLGYDLLQCSRCGYRSECRTY